MGAVHLIEQNSHYLEERYFDALYEPYTLYVFANLFEMSELATHYDSQTFDDE